MCATDIDRLKSLIGNKTAHITSPITSYLYLAVQTMNVLFLQQFSNYSFSI